MSFERPIVVLCAVIGVAAGCATAPAANSVGRSVESDRTMVELRAQNAGYLRQIEELQNRIFILEDKLDSRRVADEQRSAPVLPMSKRIGAPAADPAPLASRVLAEPPAEDESEESTVEYAGEAALPPAKRGRGRGRARPMLRLTGNGRVAAVAVALPAPPPTETNEPTKAIPVDPLRLYRQSLEALRASHHAAALAGFRKFLTRYPQHDYADNAQYWIGESYYDLNQFHAAVREFRRVVERYPHGNKVPDAMLKLGFSHLANGERHDGRRVLESLRRSYPRHAAARLASARLAEAIDRAPQPTVTLEMSR